MKDCFTVLGWTPEGRRAKGRPKTICRRTVKRERQSGVEELGCGKGSGTKQGGLGGQRDSLMCLLMRQVIRMMMMMMNFMTFD